MLNIATNYVNCKPQVDSSTQSHPNYSNEKTSNSLKDLQQKETNRNSALFRRWMAGPLYQAHRSANNLYSKYIQKSLQILMVRKISRTCNKFVWIDSHRQAKIIFSTQSTSILPMVSYRPFYSPSTEKDSVAIFKLGHRFF